MILFLQSQHTVLSPWSGNFDLKHRCAAAFPFPPRFQRPLSTVGVYFFCLLLPLLLLQNPPDSFVSFTRSHWTNGSVLHFGKQESAAEVVGDATCLAHKQASTYWPHPHILNYCNLIFAKFYKPTRKICKKKVHVHTRICSTVWYMYLMNELFSWANLFSSTLRHYKG